MSVTFVAIRGRGRIAGATSRVARIRVAVGAGRPAAKADGHPDLFVGEVHVVRTAGGCDESKK